MEEEADKSPPVPPVEPTEPNDKSPPAPPVKPSEPNVNPTPAIPPASPTNMGDVPPIKKTGDSKKTDTNANIINANLDANDTKDVDADAEDTNDSADIAIANDNGLSDNTDHAGNAVAVEPSVNAEGNGDAEGDIPIQPPVKARSHKHAIQAVDIVVTPREKRVWVGLATREALTMAELAARCGTGGADAAKKVVAPKKGAGKSKK